jgi:hypothetical protein
MRAWKRVLIKFVLLLLVITLAGGAAAGWRAYRQSTPEYVMEQYLSLLIDNNSEKAYELLDQSEDATMTAEEYAGALTAMKYSIYASYTVQEVEKRRDNDGNEYTDYHVAFQNAGDEVLAEEDFTVKKQAEAVFGVFDSWKVLSGHCMVKNFQLTVPTGAEVYLDNAKADASWITRDDVSASYDCYRLPELLPGSISLTIRHPILESVNTTLNTMDGSADYSSQMELRQSAQDACKEIGVKALKQLYSQAALQKTDELKDLFASCLRSAKSFVKKQGAEFDKEDTVFKNAGISGFAAKFEKPVFTEEENGAITTEMSLSYHYVVHEDVTVYTDEYLEDGTPVSETEEQALAGDNTAKFVMSYYDDAWHIASIDIPVIPDGE